MSSSVGSIDESERRFSPEEKELAETLAGEGRVVRAKPEVLRKRSGDAEVDGTLVEFKCFATTSAHSGTVKRTIRRSLRRGGQARHIIIDARGSGLLEAEAMHGLARTRNITRGLVDSVRIIGDAFDITSTEFRSNRPKHVR